MTFEEYLNAVVAKIGPGAAFDLSRDVRLKAIENILIRKGLVTKDEIEVEQSIRLEEAVNKILNTPPLSK